MKSSSLIDDFIDINNNKMTGYEMRDAKDNKPVEICYNLCGRTFFSKDLPKC